MKLSVALPLPLLLALLIAVPASAAGPVIYRGTCDFEAILEPQLCPCLDIVDHEMC